MGRVVQIATGHDHLKPEDYPFEIAQRINKIEDKFAGIVYSRLKLLEAKTLEYLESLKNPRKTIKEDLEEFIKRQNFLFDLTKLIPAILIGSAYARNKIVDTLKGNGVSQEDLKARIGVDLRFRPDEVMFVDLVGQRADYLSKTLAKTTLKRVNQTIAHGLKKGMSIDDIAKDLEAVGMFSRDRAELIARTEIAFALNEGTREYLGSLGIEMFQVDIAGNACELCREVQSKGPYTYNQAAGLLPVHPRCRCVWIAVIPKEWLQ